LEPQCAYVAFEIAECLFYHELVIQGFSKSFLVRIDMAIDSSFTPLIITCILLLSSSSETAGKRLHGPERHMAKINDYLMAHTTTHDIQTNMAQVRKLLDKERQRCGVPSRRCYRYFETLRKFAALSQIQGDNRCNYDSYKILKDVCEANSYRGHTVPSNLGVLRRVDLIIYEYSRNHQLYCKDVYPVKYAAKLKQLDELVLHRVKTLTDCVIRGRWLVVSPGEKADHYRFIELEKELHFGAVNWKKDVMFVLEALRILVGETNDQDAEFLNANAHESQNLVAYEPRMDEIIRKYLLRPCQQYVSEMGPEVFAPLEFDELLLEDWRRYKVEHKTTEESLFSFYSGLVYFRLCSALKDSSGELLREMIDYLTEYR